MISKSFYSTRIGHFPGMTFCKNRHHREKWNCLESNEEIDPRSSIFDRRAWINDLVDRYKFKLTELTQFSAWFLLPAQHEQFSHVAFALALSCQLKRKVNLDMSATVTSSETRCKKCDTQLHGVAWQMTIFCVFFSHFILYSITLASGPFRFSNDGVTAPMSLSNLLN